MRKYIKGCFAGCLWYFGFVVALMLGTGVLHIIGVTSDKAMGLLFIAVLVLYVLYIIYYYKKKRQVEEENDVFVEKEPVHRELLQSNIVTEYRQPEDLTVVSPKPLRKNYSKHKSNLKLENLVGLMQVKDSVERLSNFVKIVSKRKEKGMKSPNISYHCVFTGNPGTGKTTVARIIAKLYRDMGVLKSGHLIETDRSGLVAEYVGQTAVKTNNIIDSALDGVLFIDEAYTLAQGGNEDYGREAIATLLKRMEDDRERLVVILAGYTDEIEQFINSNPGLRSRFNRYIHFEDYTAEELYEIFCLQVRKNEYSMSDDAKQYLKTYLSDVVANKDKDFGNARFVRNLFERTIEEQANRLANIPHLTKKAMSEIRKEDIATKK